MPINSSWRFKSSLQYFNTHFWSLATLTMKPVIAESLMYSATF
nr:MAG TPA: hypothetical protein [Caudoviricetes sp.]